MPRHSKVYRNFAAEYDRLQAERVAAFREGLADVDSGRYPEEGTWCGWASEQMASFRALLEKA